MPRIELNGALVEVSDCPNCSRTILKHSHPACGFIAPCGRRLTNLLECESGGCTATQRDERELEIVELYRLISVMKCDPGDGTLKPTIEDVLTRGFHAMGWTNPMLASFEACYAIARSLKEPGYAPLPAEPF